MWNIMTHHFNSGRKLILDVSELKYDALPRRLRPIR